MQKRLAVFAVLLSAAGALRAQVAPAATGSAINGGLTYHLRYSEIGDHYGNGDINGQLAEFSGSLEYANESERKPFSMQFGAGYNWLVSGEDYGAGFFEHFIVSQGVDARNWNLTASDGVSYSRISPISGFSGQSGTGEPITGTGTSPSPDQSILAVNTLEVSDSSKVTYQHRLGAATTLNLTGAYELMTFPNGGADNNHTITADAGPSERLDARNTLTESYVFDEYGYSSTGFTISSNGGMFGYQRLWSRKLTTNVSIGPEWLTSSGNLPAGSSNGQQSIDSVMLGVDASATDTMRRGTAGLTYMQGANSGGGYLYGGGIKRADLSYSIQFRNQSSFELAGGWYRTAGLTTTGVINSKFGTAQFTKPLGRKFSVFGSYMATDQGSSIAVSNSILGQLWQRFSAGVSYNPTSVHF